MCLLRHVKHCPCQQSWQEKSILLFIFICILNLAAKEKISKLFLNVGERIGETIKIMDELVPNLSDDDSKKLGDIIERELKQMDHDIEEAAQRIQVCHFAMFTIH